MWTVFQALSPNTPKEFWVRAKRQQCRCVRNQNGNGLTCSCAQTPTDPNVAAAHLNSILADDVASQQQDLANQIAQQQSQQMAQNGQSGIGSSCCRCACLQIVFHGNPQYQCQCADNTGTTVKSLLSIRKETIEIKIPTTVVPTLPPITSTTTQAPITVIPTTTTQVRPK
ncbi:hypothetical protein WR25_04796 [Diploscapter pachys]|uniref:Uncharacterized protein n=1 Tax=Diploscapter pachys TaxID=2018661 RepID=A0A2A2LBZ9_9BILA|nr:hypothetical protein WR25_04796 [Diploscapter pachys]